MANLLSPSLSFFSKVYSEHRGIIILGWDKEESLTQNSRPFMLILQYFATRGQGYIHSISFLHKMHTLYKIRPGVMDGPLGAWSALQYLLALKI
jgi:hypothetical protein